MDGKIIGVLTLKVGEGENLNFAVPSKLLVPLLSNSTVQPLGSIPKAMPAAATETSRIEKLWTSLSSGKDYKLRTEGDYIYIEWVNLPSQLQGTPAFMRYELKKGGDRWVGKVRSNLPYAFKSSHMDFWRAGQQMGTENVNWCNAQFDLEIDRISDSRIEGRSHSSKSFGAKKCKPGKLEWIPFTWISK